MLGRRDARSRRTDRDDAGAAGTRLSDGPLRRPSAGVACSPRTGADGLTATRSPRLQLDRRRFSAGQMVSAAVALLLAGGTASVAGAEQPRRTAAVGSLPRPADRTHLRRRLDQRRSARRAEAALVRPRHRADAAKDGHASDALSHRPVGAGVSERGAEARPRTTLRARQPHLRPSCVDRELLRPAAGPPRRGQAQGGVSHLAPAASPHRGAPVLVRLPRQRERRPDVRRGGARAEEDRQGLPFVGRASATTQAICVSSLGAASRRSTGSPRVTRTSKTPVRSCPRWWATRGPGRSSSSTCMMVRTRRPRMRPCRG
jgi:hypothetical protein